MRARSNPSRDRNGFTILEAVVALAIIGLVSVGILAAYGATVRADVTAAERIPLAALAQERLALLDLTSGPLDRLADSVARGKFAPPYESVSWETRVERIRQTESLYDVSVDVRSRTGSYMLRTRRYRASIVAVGQ